MKVSYLRKEDIELASLSTLDAYERQFGKVVAPPIPVEEILECHLELDFGFEDLRRSQSAPDVLGAVWMHERKVRIDESLDPTMFAAKEGRYRFTVGHEVGHWQLHRHLFLANANQVSLLGVSPEPSIVCRAGSRKPPIEWQADAFASYLLMPRAMVVRVWEEVFGSPSPYFAAREIARLTARSCSSDTDVYRRATRVAREIAKVFKVSAQAMQIRLVELGLVRNEDRMSSLLG